MKNMPQTSASSRHHLQLHYSPATLSCLLVDRRVLRMSDTAAERRSRHDVRVAHSNTNTATRHQVVARLTDQ